MNRWLLVYGTLAMGGIETLILRLANYLAGMGHEVALLTAGGENLPLLESSVCALLYSDRQQALKLGLEWLDRSDESSTMVSFDPISAALALSLEMAVEKPAAHISGVYHPRAYFMDGERSDRRWLNRNVARAVGYDRLFFMNDECRREKQRRWHVNLERSPLIPLPVGEKPRIWARANSGNPLRIVSVGRLTDFKQYNLGAPFILKRLLDEGADATWDIYGTGDLETEIAAEIHRQGVEGRLRLCGNLPYPLLDEKLLSCDIFIGMGTAALEAAMLGVPTIAAADRSIDGSYGWLHQLPFGNVGERQDSGEPPFLINDLIGQYLQMSLGEREELSRELHAAAARYAMPSVVGQLVAFAESVAPGSKRLSRRAVAGLYGLLTDSFPIRWARSLRDGQAVRSSR